jgi:hypothetical protein
MDAVAHEHRVHGFPLDFLLAFAEVITATNSSTHFDFLFHFVVITFNVFSAINGGESMWVTWLVLFWGFSPPLMVVKACDLALSFANAETLLFFSLLGILTTINGSENM